MVTERCNVALTSGAHRMKAENQTGLCPVCVEGVVIFLRGGCCR